MPSSSRFWYRQPVLKSKLPLYGGETWKFIYPICSNFISSAENPQLFPPHVYINKINLTNKDAQEAIKALLYSFSKTIKYCFCHYIDMDSTSILENDGFYLASTYTTNEPIGCIHAMRRRIWVSQQDHHVISIDALYVKEELRYKNIAQNLIIKMVNVYKDDPGHFIFRKDGSLLPGDIVPFLSSHYYILKPFPSYYTSSISRYLIETDGLLDITWIAPSAKPQALDTMNKLGRLQHNLWVDLDAGMICPHDDFQIIHVHNLAYILIHAHQWKDSVSTPVYSIEAVIFIKRTAIDTLGLFWLALYKISLQLGRRDIYFYIAYMGDITSLSMDQASYLFYTERGQAFHLYLYNSFILATSDDLQSICAPMI
jgi:hypothetical protein